MCAIALVFLDIVRFNSFVLKATMPSAGSLPAKNTVLNKNVQPPQQYWWPLEIDYRVEVIELQRVLQLDRC